MTSVYLYGELRNKFGEEFNFKINSPKEALLAINANRKGFLDEIKKEALKGVLYRVVIDDKVAEDKCDILVNKTPKEIHIVPVIWGAGKNSGGILMLAAGIVLVGLTAGAAAGLLPALTSGAGALAAAGGTTAAMASLTTLGSVVAMLGASLAVQGIMSLLYPPPKPDFNQEVQAGGKSYLFGGRQNNTTQGQAVPVGYGRLLIGSSQISSATSHYSLKQDMRALMTPTDEPINDYTKLNFKDEVAGVVKGDSFYTNQSSAFDDSPSFSSLNVLNSYIHIATTSAETVTSSVVEAVVKTNGQVVSNPDLTSYDEDLSFSWTETSEASNAGNIKIENPYSFNEGLVYRIYTNGDYKLYNSFNQDVTSTHSSSSFKLYNYGDMVRFGPAQFNRLNFQTWDANVTYIRGDLVVYNNLYYWAILGGTNHSPSEVSSLYWVNITAPANEEIFQCIDQDYNATGYLPTGGSSAWYKKLAPQTTSSELGYGMNETLNSFSAPFKEGIYTNIIEATNASSVDGDNNSASLENYMMEFLGYLYVPKIIDREVSAKYSTEGVMYEITKVGDTNWAAIGVVGEAVIGTTFTKNSTAATGTGKVYPVIRYKFTLDCDDAADLYIDGELVASRYVTPPAIGNSLASPTNSAGIQSLAATNAKVIKLTTGYHRIYTRLYNHLLGSGLSLYYQSDSNWDGNAITGDGFSDWTVIPANRLFHQKLTDLNVPKNLKFLSLIASGSTNNFVTGSKYKIIGSDLIEATALTIVDNGTLYEIAYVGDTNWAALGLSGTAAIGKTFTKSGGTGSGTGKVMSLGTTNWTSIGASSPKVGSVFIKNSTAATGTTQFLFSDTFSSAEVKSANSNRIMRFIAQRPKKDESSSKGTLTIYSASFECRVQTGRITLYSSPVRIYIKFLPVNSSFRSVVQGEVLPTEA